MEIQQDLKKLRKSIEKADLFIAAIAVANNLRLDTLNRKHFDNIGQLRLLDNSGG
jgi:tRNA(fMet)-specific endonuclease VapC